MEIIVIVQNELKIYEVNCLETEKASLKSFQLSKIFIPNEKLKCSCMLRVSNMRE